MFWNKVEVKFITRCLVIEKVKKRVIKYFFSSKKVIILAVASTTNPKMSIARYFVLETGMFRSNKRI